MSVELMVRLPIHCREFARAYSSGHRPRGPGRGSRGPRISVQRCVQLDTVTRIVVAHCSTHVAPNCPARPLALGMGGARSSLCSLGGHRRGLLPGCGAESRQVVAHPRSATPTVRHISHLVVVLLRCTSRIGACAERQPSRVVPGLEASSAGTTCIHVHRAAHLPVLAHGPWSQAVRGHRYGIPWHGQAGAQTGTACARNWLGCSGSELGLAASAPGYSEPGRACAPSLRSICHSPHAHPIRACCVRPCSDAGAAAAASRSCAMPRVACALRGRCRFPRRGQRPCRRPTQQARLGLVWLGRSARRVIARARRS